MIMAITIVIFKIYSRCERKTINEMNWRGWVGFVYDVLTLFQLSWRYLTIQWGVVIAAKPDEIL